MNRDSEVEFAEVEIGKYFAEYQDQTLRPAIEAREALLHLAHSIHA